MKRTRLCLTILLVSGLLLGSGTVWASEDKSIIKIGSDVTIENGMKVRNVVTVGGQITVDGTVDNNVVAIGGSVVLTKKAVVGGNVFSLGGVIVSARDAQVGGSMTEINSSNLYETLTAAMSAEWEGWSWIFAVISLAIILVILVVALLVVALLPKPVRIVAEAIRENTFKVALCGLLGLVLIAPLALLLTISVIGIALIPLEVIIVVASVLLGFIAVGRLIGGSVLHRLKRPNRGMIRETFWGLIVLWLIGWIPYIGWMVKAVAIVLGLGAVLITRFGTHQGWKCTPAAPISVAPDSAVSGAALPGPVAPDSPAVDRPAETGVRPDDNQGSSGPAV
jgi:hypothetical protein